MINSIEIRNFKGIKKMKISGLRKVNLFLGKNNSGKSSILESIYLISYGFSEFDSINRKDKMEVLLNRRCERGLKGEKRDTEILWYNYEKSKPIQFKLGFNNFHIEIELSDIHEHPLVILNEEKYGYKYWCAIHKRSYVSDGSSSKTTSLDSASSLLKIKKREMSDLLKYMEGITIIDSGLLHRFEEVERRIWEEVFKRRIDKEIVSLLRDGYGLNAENITYVPFGDKDVLMVGLPRSSVRLDDLGDGSRMSFLMTSISLLSERSALLLEEPESHQHPLGLYKTMDLILKSAKKRNNQILITTHSLELSKIVSKICSESEIELSMFFLERDNKGVVSARKLSGEDLENLEKIGIDVRFLYAF